MNLTVNGEDQTVSAKTLDVLIAELGFEPEFLATALNSDFVPVEERADCVLKEGDKIEILSPRQGG
ncbi:sulfur carrier protein ThiS [Roseibium sp.]|uniref:sulfur carrier protein ThiS n=1 Tax=Roseibium sp. TaxID=1936156 RepID=UPI003B5167B5